MKINKELLEITDLENIEVCLKLKTKYMIKNIEDRNENGAKI